MVAGGLEDLLDRIPLLAARPRTVEELPGGLTNVNLKVTTPTGVYVARVGGPGAEALGIDRDAEHHNSRAAAEAGVGAPVVDYRPDLGVLVVDYLEGRTLGNADFDDPDVCRRAALAVRRLHEGPAFSGVFDMVDRQAAYLATAQRRGHRLPEDYLDHEATFLRIRDALAVHPPAVVPCHNDLLAANFIDGTEMRIIDYEYAGANDPAFELGNLAGECGLDDDGLALLVTTYAGRERPELVARARLQQAVGQYGWTLWGCLQAAESDLDFDFWGWAVERYDKAVALFGSDALPGLIEEVTR